MLCPVRMAAAGQMGLRACSSGENGGCRTNDDGTVFHPVKHSFCRTNGLQKFFEPSYPATPGIQTAGRHPERHLPLANPDAKEDSPKAEAAPNQRFRLRCPFRTRVRRPLTTRKVPETIVYRLLSHSLTSSSKRRSLTLSNSNKHFIIMVIR